MIDFQALDLSQLPWLPLDARSAFPRNPAIYFALDGRGTIQYISRTIDHLNLVNYSPDGVFEINLDQPFRFGVVEK